MDPKYNVTVCTECCTGVAFDYIQSHLRSQHGIKRRLNEVMEHLNIEAPALSSVEIKAWMSEVWILDRAIQGVPVKKGLECTLCHYSGARKKAMKDHFGAKHQNIKWSKNITRCNVQMPFQGHLKKYILIKDAERQDIEINAQNDLKTALEHEFQEVMSESLNAASKKHSDARLLSAFIARMRWDLRVKDMDLCMLYELAKTPVKSDRLFQVILCGRKYIETCCSILDAGNIMLKRRLISAG